MGFESPAEAPPVEDAVEKATLLERLSGLERLAEELKNERDAWREQASEQASSARELRILLRNAQELALPAHISQGESAQTVREDVHEEGEAKGLGARLRAWFRG